MALKPRILVLGHADPATGYGRVLSSICRRLAQKYTILQINISSNKAVHDPLNYTIEPAQGVLNEPASQQLVARIEQFQPQLLFLCHDPWLYQFHRQALAAYRDRLKIIFYCPVEGPYRSPAQIAYLAEVDVLVLYTSYGRRLIEDAFEQAALPPTSWPRIAVLPHGIDTQHFFPLHPFTAAGEEERQRNLLRARQILFPHRPELHSAFMLLNANYYRQRKRIDLTVQAFADFIHATPGNIWLYLHVGEQEQKLLELAARLGIRDRVLSTGTAVAERPITDSLLNTIYNACDIGINTATSEGWGLVAFEHAATGAAQIVPAHSACQELWHDHGLLIPLQTRQPPDFQPAELQVGEIHPAELTSLLSLLYQNHAMRQHYSQQAHT
ncbi:glycosyltransferase, partial [Dictyobacter arantiisoli]|uniref:glycosyltransferase n=1 Tax=Dictyobacter arantiisoli TaxID=2014874 RepID=UPI00155A4145